MEAPSRLIPAQAKRIAVDDVRLGIVCPMANEAATAVRFVDAVLSACDRYGFDSVTFFAVVDTVSRDDTRELLEAHVAAQSELSVIWAPETQGVADAYIRGYREALDAGSDWILEIDAGFSHEPSDIPRFIDAMADGRDCVFGSRFREGGRNLGTLRRRVISRGGTALTNLLLGTKLTDMTSGFQLFTRAALETVLAKGISSKGPFFQTEIKTHCRHLDVAEIPIGYNAGTHSVGHRAITESFVTLWRLFRRRLAGDL
jgi:dolichol-phosphate mannosyltransferase